jgi:hypothetical protein
LGFLRPLKLPNAPRDLAVLGLADKLGPLPQKVCEGLAELSGRQRFLL